MTPRPMERSRMLEYFARAMLSGEVAPQWRPYLQRMSLAAPTSMRERLLQRQVLAALRLTPEISASSA